MSKGIQITKNTEEYILNIPMIQSMGFGSATLNDVIFSGLTTEQYENIKSAVEAYVPSGGGGGGSYADGYADGSAAMESAIASSQAVTANLYKSKLASEDADIAAADSTDIDGQGTIFSESYQYLKTPAEMQANYDSGYSAGEAAVATSQQPVAADYKSLLSGVDQTIAAADPTTLAGQMSIFSESYQYLNTGGGSGTPVRYIARPGMKTTLNAWTDGTNIYTGTYSDTYRFDPSTGLFEKFALNKSTSITMVDGTRIWTHGTEAFIFYGSGGYILDKSTSMWVTMSWSGNLPRSIESTCIWTDGTNFYYSYNSDQYIIDVNTSTWSAKTWTGLTNFSGWHIWTDGTDIYYSNTTDQYVLDKATSTWSAKTWTGLTSFYGSSIWTDGTDIYYSNSSDQYVLDKATSTWTQKTWTGLTSFNGANVWTDGTDIYFSDSPSQYVLDKATSTWTSKAWNGYSPSRGGGVWTDGTNIYYDSGPNNNHYVLDKTTSTWTQKAWYSTIKSYDGSNIWSDGTNIYYSYTSEQYIFDRSTSSWIARYWSGYNFRASFLWTDGTDIYCSNGSSQYVLSSAYTWSAKTWTGLTNPNANYIWTDGTDTYYSNDSSQYVLDKATSTWSAKTWTGLTSFYGNGVWTDGTDIYCGQYVLDKSTSTWTLTQVEAGAASNAAKSISTDPTKNWLCRSFPSTFGQDRTGQFGIYVQNTSTGKFSMFDKANKTWTPADVATVIVGDTDLVVNSSGTKTPVGDVDLSYKPKSNNP